jgi:hypothetical protein
MWSYDCTGLTPHCNFSNDYLTYLESTNYILKYNIFVHQITAATRGVSSSSKIVGGDQKFVPPVGMHKWVTYVSKISCIIEMEFLAGPNIRKFPNYNHMCDCAPPLKHEGNFSGRTRHWQYVCTFSRAWQTMMYVILTQSNIIPIHHNQLWENRNCYKKTYLGKGKVVRSFHGCLNVHQVIQRE